MKKANIEQFSMTGRQLYVDETPKQTDKTVKLWGASAYALLVKTWVDYRDKLVISIDEGGGAISLFIAKSKIGNGYIKREMESGERVVGRTFDIVSPIYFIQNPERGAAGTHSGLKKTYDATNLENSYCIFFPNTVKNLYAIYNNTSPTEAFARFKVRYGLAFGVAGKSLFFETISFEVDTTLTNGSSKLNQISVNNNAEEGTSDTAAWIGGYYKIL